MISGVHVVRRKLADGEVRQYIYEHRGGPSLGIIRDGEDVVDAVRDALAERRNSVVRDIYRRCAKRAADRQLPCDISEEWIHDTIFKQGERCPISGLPFDYGREAGAWAPNRPSADRIDPSQGYTPQNTRIVLTSVNIAINQWGLDNFLNLARAVTEHNPPQPFLKGE